MVPGNHFLTAIILLIRCGEVSKHSYQDQNKICRVLYKDCCQIFKNVTFYISIMNCLCSLYNWKGCNGFSLLVCFHIVVIAAERHACFARINTNCSHFTTAETSIVSQRHQRETRPVGPFAVILLPEDEGYMHVLFVRHYGLLLMHTQLKQTTMGISCKIVFAFLNHIGWQVRWRGGG